jgi:hypothetical protein
VFLTVCDYSVMINKENLILLYLTNKQGEVEVAEKFCIFANYNRDATQSWNLFDSVES